MKNKYPIIGILLGVGVLLAFVLACREQGKTPLVADPNIAPRFPINPPVNPPVPQEYVIPQERLRDYWNGSNHDDWDVIAGVVDPDTGGHISGSPRTWGPSYTFGIRVLAGTEVLGDPTKLNLPPLEEGIPLALYVPRWPSFPGDTIPAVYKLRPEVEFSQPVQIELCYTPWNDPDSVYTKFCFWEVPGFADSFATSDVDYVRPAGEDWFREIIFETSHFSRWGLENGKTGGGGPIGD